MTCQDNNKVLNGVLIEMAHSFLQYVAESSPWVSTKQVGLAERVEGLAAAQRQDVGEIANLLTSREFAVDFGTFPTEYTDLQFLSLSRLIGLICSGQDRICRTIENGVTSLQTAGDIDAAELLDSILAHERELGSAFEELARELTSPVAAS
ncbi:MAG: hypothetical protein KDA96_09025 [Planctomycetaceae bacterium]|nr:hypothetical protein [Planctomycetaceae bacterium]